eukprot:15097662-Alexandrium_andersonii.AAC.1
MCWRRPPPQADAGAPIGRGSEHAWPWRAVPLLWRPAPLRHRLWACVHVCALMARNRCLPCLLYTSDAADDM